MRPGNPSTWNGGGLKPDPRTPQQHRDYMRAPLNIPTPEVSDPELKKRWHGVPPTKRTIPKRDVGTIEF